MHEVAKKIKVFRKPKWMVPGDVFTSLMTAYSGFFAVPLTEIYNEISRTYIWPVAGSGNM